MSQCQTSTSETLASLSVQSFPLACPRANDLYTQLSSNACDVPHIEEIPYSEMSWYKCGEVSMSRGKEFASAWLLLEKLVEVLDDLF
jgi:hypothetical protein